MGATLGALVVANVIGLFVGMAGSLLAWWVTYHALAPKVKFAAFVRRRPSLHNPDRPAYAVKFCNVGRRNLVDVSIHARLAVKGLGTPSTLFVRLGLTWTGDHELYIPMIRKRGGNRAVELMLDCSPDLSHTPRLASALGMAERTKPPELEEVLALTADTRIVVAITGSDSFSGSRHAFIQEFGLADVRRGRFEGIGFVEELAAGASAEPPTKPS